MHRYKAAILLLLCASTPVLGSTPWGADYFPNVPLVTHEGKTVRFFDDLIQGKVVLINFIYTSCPDTCPLETAQLAKVQRILGDRVGRDIFMYSITIDPENDTPEVLAQYRKRYRAPEGWWFLTGEESDITLLRKKLGLYIEEIQDGSNNHNVNLIIGNQTTGQWMKRSPFENPYVLATQAGTWLTGWKGPPREDLGFANAPNLRDISQGEHLYRTRCAPCHSIGGGDEGLAPGLVGPDLLWVTKRRERSWLNRWLAEPDKMLEEGDPIALGLYGKYNKVPMPNMRLSGVDVKELIAYLDSQSRRVQMDRARRARRDRTVALASAPSGVVPAVHVHVPDSGPPPAVHAVETHVPVADAAAEDSGDTVAIMNAWIREAHPEAAMNAGYMTLINVGSEDVTLVGLESPAFEEVEIHEMAMVDGLMKMRDLTEMVVPSGGQARLEPGGTHLMLKGPQQHLTEGQTVDLTLTFRSGRQQTVSVRVAAR